MKSSRNWIAIILILLVVIAVMAWFLFMTPAPNQPSTSGTSQTPTTSPATTASNPEGVIVMQPQENATVGQTFNVSGHAPNTWYDEAVFPIQVRDENDNLIGTAQAQAQSDWTVSGPVSFKAAVNLVGNDSGPANVNENDHMDYVGPATLILLKSNPSGLPENDDELTVPITIQ